MRKRAEWKSVRACRRAACGFALVLFAMSAYAGEQFDLQCRNGTHLGRYVVGQNSVSARNRESPMGLFYCPSDRKIYNIRTDDRRLHDGTCAVPFEDVEVTYLSFERRPPFPLCDGGYLADPRMVMFFD